MAAPPQPMQQMQAQMQEQLLPRPDPVMQAVIEADFRTVDLTMDSNNVTALCASHSREKCDECDVDYVQLNRLSKVLTANPKLPSTPALVQVGEPWATQKPPLVAPGFPLTDCNPAEVTTAEKG